jgi:membrane-associated phospholipid phosphatase
MKDVLRHPLFRSLKCSIFCVVLLLWKVTTVYSQFNQQAIVHVDDTIVATPTKKTNWKRTTYIPLTLVTLGALGTLDNSIIDSKEIREERNEYTPNFRHNADNYLQFAPIIAVYGLNACGIKGKNSFANRTAILIKAEVIVAAVTFSLKKITAVPRPDTGQPTSFPSGHTAEAFAAATFMAKEYGDQSVWYPIGAYTIATGIGAMRVLNNRHWVSDVLAGAGIGILSTEIAYLTHQYKWTKKKRNAIITPAYSKGAAGLYMRYTL